MAKGAAVVLGGFVALQLLPELLKPPPPEPLPADVGLPRVVDSAPRAAELPTTRASRAASPPARRVKRRGKRHLGREAVGGGVRAGRRRVFRPNQDLGRAQSPGRKT